MPFGPPADPTTWLRRFRTSTGAVAGVTAGAACTRGAAAGGNVPGARGHAARFVRAWRWIAAPRPVMEHMTAPRRMTNGGAGQRAGPALRGITRLGVGCRKPGSGRSNPWGGLLGDCERAAKAARGAVLCGGRDGPTSQEKNRDQRRRQRKRAGADRRWGRPRLEAGRSPGPAAMPPFRQARWQSARCRTPSPGRQEARQGQAGPYRHAKDSEPALRGVPAAVHPNPHGVPPEGQRRPRADPLPAARSPATRNQSAAQPGPGMSRAGPPARGGRGRERPVRALVFRRCRPWPCSLWRARFGRVGFRGARRGDVRRRGCADGGRRSGRRDAARKLAARQRGGRNGCRGRSGHHRRNHAGVRNGGVRHCGVRTLRGPARRRPGPPGPPGRAEGQRGPARERLAAGWSLVRVRARREPPDQWRAVPRRCPEPERPCRVRCPVRCPPRKVSGPERRPPPSWPPGPDPC